MIVATHSKRFSRARCSMLFSSPSFSSANIRRNFSSDARGTPITFLWPWLKPRPCASSGSSIPDAKFPSPGSPLLARSSSYVHTFGSPMLEIVILPMKAPSMQIISLMTTSSRRRKSFAWTVG